MLFKMCQSLEKKGSGEKLPYFFHEARITLIPTTNEDQTQKENCRPILLYDFDAETLHKTLANKTLSHIKEYIL